MPGHGARGPDSLGFQFIEFPSEWGEEEGVILAVTGHRVSNLLSSPASGECRIYMRRLTSISLVSNLLSSPASGEGMTVNCPIIPDVEFPIY